MDQEISGNEVPLGENSDDYNNNATNDRRSMVVTAMTKLDRGSTGIGNIVGDTSRLDFLSLNLS